VGRPLRQRRAGGAIAVDPNVRPELAREDASRRALDALIAGAAYATPSEEDLSALFPGASLAEAAAALAAQGVGIVAVTRGAEGAVVFAPDGPIDLAGHAVDIADPTGAGDAFAATLVALHRGGVPLAEAARLANAAGALAVTRLGRLEGNSRLADLKRFVGDTA